MALDQKYLYPFFGSVVVDLKPLNYLPWGAIPKKTFQHNFGVVPFGPKIFVALLDTGHCSRPTNNHPLAENHAYYTVYFT